MDVTNRILACREAMRGLWNTYLRHELRPKEQWDTLNWYREVCRGLFEILVLRSLGVQEDAWPEVGSPHPYLLVRPKWGEICVQVRRPGAEGNVSWDDPVRTLRGQGTTLHFVDFFDWYPIECWDLQYFRVMIAGCEDHPEVVGREALIEVLDAVVDLQLPASS